MPETNICNQAAEVKESRMSNWVGKIQLAGVVGSAGRGCEMIQQEMDLELLTSRGSTSESIGRKWRAHKLSDLRRRELRRKTWVKTDDLSQCSPNATNVWRAWQLERPLKMPKRSVFCMLPVWRWSKEPDFFKSWSCLTTQKPILMINTGKEQYNRQDSTTTTAVL